MSRACLITLVAFAAISCVAASRILEEDAAAMGRELLQTKADRFVCSKWCADNQCIRVGTTGLVKCNKCKHNLKPILSGINAGQCGCPAGTYFTSSTPDCIPCEFGSYCFKQLTWINNTASGSAIGKTDCTTGLTTRARRSTSVWDCVNKGGYYQNNTATGPVATACTGNTYAIAKSKQSACTPCPSGMVVSNATDARDRPTACKVPIGYFMKSPGQIAPCDQGSYQDKYLGADQASVGACTACPEGVTTTDKGSTELADCNKLKPGYVATKVTANKGIEEATLCPQGWYCPGDVTDSVNATQVSITGLNIDGDGNLISGDYVATVSGATGSGNSGKIIQCPNQAWTKDVGATAVDQCMVPPGWEIVGSADITQCLDNKYRSEWISLAAAATATKKCVACGADILAEAIEPITLYSLNTTTGVDANTDYTVVNIKVKATSKSCYIVKGQGIYYISSGTSMVYKARDCGLATGVANSYGVAGDKVYGLAQTPCKLCPAGTQVDEVNTPSSGYKATHGFYDPLACVTKAGYGWDGRVASLCAKGWFNPGNNYKACTQCAYGLTTLDPVANGTATNGTEDCLAAPGFGMYISKMQLCPAGYYNDEVRATAECTACPDNSWTAEEGSDALTDCSVCQPGYGPTPGSTGTDVVACNATKCGGDSADGSYGPADREGLACLACPTSDVGFQFWYNNTRYNYTSPARAVAAAQDAAECVAGMAQIEDGLWFLAGAEGVTATNEADIAACASACLLDATCAVATFDYEAVVGSQCKTLKIASEATDDAVVTAFKAVPSSDVSQSRKLQAAKPKAVSTGMYTQWWYAGIGIGTQTTVSAANKAACFDACDAADNCAGVVYTKVGPVCKLITGDTAPDGEHAAKRSLTKAVPSRFIKEPAR